MLTNSCANPLGCIKEEKPDVGAIGRIWQMMKTLGIDGKKLAAEACKKACVYPSVGWERWHTSLTQVRGWGWGHHGSRDRLVCDWQDARTLTHNMKRSSP